MANRYSFNIEWSDEDEEYIATCPAFPGLSAFGETEEEALSEDSAGRIFRNTQSQQDGVTVTDRT
jgi:hypothetical protein